MFSDDMWSDAESPGDNSGSSYTDDQDWGWEWDNARLWAIVISAALLFISFLIYNAWPAHNGPSTSASLIAVWGSQEQPGNSQPTRP